MRRPISFTFIIIVTICSLMNIIALMPATEAYEILFRNWGGLSTTHCAVWEEDYNHHFITYIPPDAPHNGDSYYFNCATFNGMENRGADLRNGILTQKTLDNSTAYWVIFTTIDVGGENSAYSGGYNKNTCFHVLGGGGHHLKPRADLDEVPYEECQKIRDS